MPTCTTWCATSSARCSRCKASAIRKARCGGFSRAAIGAWRALLTGADFEAGCALLAVTVAADAPALRDAAAESFRTWRARLARALHEGGLGADRAADTAQLLLAASEGAVVLSRAERDIRPFDTVAAQLLDHVRRLS